MDLTDEQWDVLKPIIPVPLRRADGRGRPWHDARAVLNGILWSLRTGAPWKDVPPRYPPYPTGHRRFQPWVRAGGLERIFRALATDLEERGGIELAACFLDGTFVVATTGGAVWERPRGAKGRRSWQLSTMLVFLSPPTVRVLRRMRSPVLHHLSPQVLSMTHLSVGSGTTPTIATRLLRAWPTREWR